MAKTSVPGFGTRPIRTDYYSGGRRSGAPVKTNRGRWAVNAAPNAVMHMQLDTYHARLCEVWDERTGELFAQIKRSVTGNIEITYSRLPELGY